MVLWFIERGHQTQKVALQGLFPEFQVHDAATKNATYAQITESWAQERETTEFQDLLDASEDNQVELEAFTWFQVILAGSGGESGEIFTQQSRQEFTGFGRWLVTGGSCLLKVNREEHSSSVGNSRSQHLSQ